MKLEALKLANGRDGKWRPLKARDTLSLQADHAQVRPGIQCHPSRPGHMTSGSRATGDAGPLPPRAGRWRYTPRIGRIAARGNQRPQATRKSLGRRRALDTTTLEHIDCRRETPDAILQRMLEQA